uniref:Uncharacterized protein n=1 Tax=Sus scrofa TaxID=9823 RepID=A0A8D1XQ05_PIG
MIFVFLCLTMTLSMIISKSIHVAANGIISFFFMPEKYSVGYMYHIFFIHFSADGHLDCFHILAIVNSAAMNIGVHESFGNVVFFGYMPQSRIAKSHGSFSGNSMLPFTVAAPIYIPTNNEEVFSFLHTLSSIYCL